MHICRLTYFLVLLLYCCSKEVLMTSSSSNVGSRVKWIKFDNMNCVAVELSWLKYRWLLRIRTCYSIAARRNWKTRNVVCLAGARSCGNKFIWRKWFRCKEDVYIWEMKLIYWFWHTILLLMILKKDFDVKISAMNKLMEDEIKTMKQDSEIHI